MIPDEGQGYLAAAQEFCQTLEEKHLEVTNGSAFKFAYVQCLTEAAEDTTAAMREYGDIYCVCRFGDDLGFKSSTLIDSQDIRGFILPQYKRIVDMVHAAGKPFLLHSCGNIFDVMEDIIAAGIDAKHSNEDQIAPMSEWVERYGDRIGNFGGLDTDHLVRMPLPELEQKVRDLWALACGKNGGFAIGSGNSIPAYVDDERYLLFLKTVRTLRGDFED